jgi:hypothetical protein
MRLLSTALASIAAATLCGAMFTGSAEAMPKPAELALAGIVELAAGEKKAGPGRCGAMKYWDKKTRQCADATQKKSS